MANARKFEPRGLDQASDTLAQRSPEFRELLLARRNALLRSTAAERAELDEQVRSSPGDVGDESVLDTTADYYLKLADNDRREIAEINDALRRMQRGAYGICEVCENDIPFERLEKLPHARRCIDCQSLLENRSRAARMAPGSKL